MSQGALGGRAAAGWSGGGQRSGLYIGIARVSFFARDDHARGRVAVWCAWCAFRPIPAVQLYVGDKQRTKLGPPQREQPGIGAVSGHQLDISWGTWPRWSHQPPSPSRPPFVSWKDADAQSIEIV